MDGGCVGGEDGGADVLGAAGVTVMYDVRMLVIVITFVFSGSEEAGGCVEGVTTGWDEVVGAGAGEAGGELGGETLDSDCVTVSVDDCASEDDDADADGGALPFRMARAAFGSLQPMVTPSTRAMGSATQICLSTHATGA